MRLHASTAAIHGGLELQDDSEEHEGLEGWGGKNWGSSSSHLDPVQVLLESLDSGLFGCHLRGMLLLLLLQVCMHVVIALVCVCVCAVVTQCRRHSPPRGKTTTHLL